MLLWQGMGEGEGAKDVSDQITDEDQLLGAQQKDQPADAPKVPCSHRTPVLVLLSRTTCTHAAPCVKQ